MPIIADDEGEMYDDGKTQEPCPTPGCNGTKMWKRGKWRSRFLACSKYPKCAWTSYRKKEETSADADFPEQQIAA